MLLKSLSQKVGKNMPKRVVVYLSTTGNTKSMADAIVEGARSRNIEASVKLE